MQQYLFNLTEVYFDSPSPYPFWQHLNKCTVWFIFLDKKVLVHCQK